MEATKLSTPVFKTQRPSRQIKRAARDALFFPILYWSAAFVVAYGAFSLGFLKDGSPGLKLVSDVVKEGFNLGVFGLYGAIWIVLSCIFVFVDVQENKGIPELIEHARHRIADSFATVGWLSAAFLALSLVIDFKDVHQSFVAQALFLTIFFSTVATFLHLKPASPPFDRETLSKADFERMLGEIRFGQGFLISDALLETAYPRNVASNSGAVSEAIKNADLKFYKLRDSTNTFIFRERSTPAIAETDFWPKASPFPDLS